MDGRVSAVIRKPAIGISESKSPSGSPLFIKEGRSPFVQITSNERTSPERTSDLLPPSSVRRMYTFSSDCSFPTPDDI